MPSILLAGPAAEPLTLAEAKAWLRVEHGDDDAAIAALVAAACTHVEAHTRRALMTQSWRILRDEWPADGRIAVLPAPLRELHAVRVHLAGGPEDIGPEAFVLDTAAAPGIVAFPPGTLIAPSRAIGGIELDIEAGYGDEPSDVPQALRQAIRLLLARWYENRGAMSEAGAGPLPRDVAALIAPYRAVTL